MRKSGNEIKKEIREAYPELKHRDLSVKYNGSYRIELKVLFPLSKIKDVVDKYESYQRCHASGEILQGGNTFVFVNYMSWNCSKDERFEVPVPEEFKEAVEKVLPRFEHDNWKNENHRYGGKEYHLSQALKEEEYFADWKREDIASAIYSAKSSHERLNNWFNF